MDFNIYTKINLGLIINNNNLHTNINLNTDFSININLNIYMRINTRPININLYQINFINGFNFKI